MIKEFVFWLWKMLNFTLIKKERKILFESYLSRHWRRWNLKGAHFMILWTGTIKKDLRCILRRMACSSWQTLRKILSNSFSRSSCSKSMVAWLYNNKRMNKVISMEDLKGTYTWLVKFAYNFFLPQTVIKQQYEVICKQNYHFHTHCSWNRATCCIWRKRK